jgi:hypothetical protein
MRSSPGSFRLSFLLPPGVTAAPDTYSGWVPHCAVEIDRLRAVITGPSKDAVIEQAARLVRVICLGRRDLSIDATLESPPPLSGRDAWTIVVGADIAFLPTGLGALFPERAIA